jgi:condensin complex subunit 1
MLKTTPRILLHIQFDNPDLLCFLFFFFKVSALWDFFSFNVSGSGVIQSRGALIILCMAAKSSPSILGSHLSEIIDIGFGRRSKEEPLLARIACLALERLSNDDRKKLIAKNNRVFGSLLNLIMGFWLPDTIWYTAVDKAINTIYVIHPAPEMFASEIVKRSFSAVFVNGIEGEEGSHLESLSSVPVAKLGRFLFIVSHVALNHLVYVESCVRKIQKQRGSKDKSGPVSENNEVSEVLLLFIYFLNFVLFSVTNF